MGRGRKDKYARKVIEEKGPNIIKELFRRAHKSKVWTKAELDQIAEEKETLIKSHESRLRTNEYHR